MSVEHLAKTFLSPAVPIPPAIAETRQQYTERLYAERNAWAAQCQRAEAEVAELMERNKTLQARVDVLGEFCRNTPQMREVIGELRFVHMDLESATGPARVRQARDRIVALLRRLDRESQQETR